ncbi:MAG: mechanosensitive ion channel family protein [Bacteroidetes bacterium]|nr:mechanosensitive ion channel family protein [Bacteroidota bacterium]
MMEEFFKNEFSTHILVTAGIVVSAFILVKLSKRFARSYFDDPEKVYRSSKSARRLAIFLTVVASVIVWSPGFGDFVTLLTVIGAGMAIALREVLLSVAGWARITVYSALKEGDRVEINGIRGDVVDVRMLRTSLMEVGGWVDADQSTGRLVHFPNSWLFEFALFNYTRAFKFIWNELPVVVTFRSDWRAARDIMQKYAQESAQIIEQQARQEIHEVSKEFLVHYSILTPFVYVKIDRDGVELTLRYLCEARKRRGTEHALTEMILDEFKNHPNIELAYRSISVVSRSDLQFEGMPSKSTSSSAE